MSISVTHSVCDGQHLPFTKTANCLYDIWQPRISPVAWSILSSVVRCTVGYHRDSDPIAIERFKTLTGIQSKNTIKRGIRELEAIHLICVQHAKGRHPATFSVNWDVAIGSNFDPLQAVAGQSVTPLKSLKESEQGSGTWSETGQAPATVTAGAIDGYPDDSGIYDEWTFNSPNFDLAEAMSKRADSCKRTKPRKAEIYDAVAVAVRHGFDEALEYENE